MASGRWFRMREYRKVKLGDIFTLEKGSLQSSKCTPGQYDFITAAEDWKTHESYTHDCEAIVYAVAASGSLGRAHYVNGKFIASDLCFIMQEKDKEKYPVNFQFYQIIFEVLRDEIVSKTKTGTSKESISQKNLAKYEIPYFDYDFQIANYERLVRTKQIIAEISKETESQKAYAKQLRQNILQDAIEGKLTAEWRKTHPVIKGNPDFDAEALFEEIQKEKKSDKKQKELAPIGDDEKPFEIPEGWEWITMGDIYSFSNGTASRGSANGRPYPVLRLADLSNNYIDLNDVRNINLTDNEFNSHRVFNDDLIFIRVNGSKDRVGNAFLFTSDNPVSYCDHLFCGHKISKFISSSFTMLEFNSSFARNQIIPLIKTTTGQNTINQGNMSIIKLPFPPFEEQKEIVKRVNENYKIIKQLEQKISQREEYANQLMQSILKDAFEER